MMQINTTVKESTIPGAGLGLFAVEDIKKDTIIWIFNPLLDRVITEEEFNKLNTFEKAYVKTYAYLSDDKDYSTNGKTNYILCIDNGRFFNHSTTLNNVIDTHDLLFGSITVTARDIKAGEELLCNYGVFYNNFDNINKNYK